MSATGSNKAAMELLLAEIAPDVAKVEAAIELVADAPAGYVRELVEHVRGFGGKRLRPAMVLLAGRAVNPEKTGDQHARLGAVVELIHTATLVHDDILDGALMRRGRPTLHKMEGQEVAVLLGDFLLASAYAEAASISGGAAHYLAHVTRQVCQGEVLQVHERGNLDLEEKTYLEIIEKKTAILYAASCRVGAEYAGGTAEEIAALDAFGLGIGMAFQVIDDVLDLVGDEQVVGKSLGTDLQRQKMTLPLIHFMRTADSAIVASVRDALSSGRGFEMASVIRDAVVANGSVDAARDRAEKMVVDASARLDVLRPSRERETLRRIADYVLERKR
ncbi:MAG: polyprenyl synthetase family protein [Planctomycetes bacterium]|nr:polyprenyl synthetase family protein [Planctomycetota bacterium]